MSVETKDYAITLKAPNATRPTQDTDLQVHDVYIGPKRTVRRVRYTPGTEIRWFVPEYSTWTLDTLRIVLHELATFLPVTHPEEQAIAEIGDSLWDRGTRVWVRVSAPALGDNRRHRVEAGFTIEKTHLSEPMRAAMASLPHVPLKLSAIDCPESQGEAEMPADDLPLATEQQVQRIAAALRDIGAAEPASVADIERLVNLIAKRLDDE